MTDYLHAFWLAVLQLVAVWHLSDMYRDTLVTARAQALFR